MSDYIPRKLAPKIIEASQYYQVLTVTGPRQVGKTTLCRHLFENYTYRNLEDLSLREVASTDPKAFLQGCGNHAIIDEIQHVPSLLSYIQLEVDNNPDARYVLTGSSNFALMEGITQSLAGRSALFTLLPFAIDELGDYADETATDPLLYRGFYPAIFTRKTPPELFYRNYYNTYIERDLRQLLKVKNLDNFQRFIRLCAGRTGSEFNASALANEVGVSSPTISEWTSILRESYILFYLPPYYVNINKRLTKSPKIYFYDTGLLCFLLGIEAADQLATHPLRGSIFENLAVIELMKKRFNADRPANLYFYRENSGKEVDILRENATGLDIFEIKSAKTYNKDFKKNLEYLKNLLGDKIQHAEIVYDGTDNLPGLINIRQISMQI